MRPDALLFGESTGRVIAATRDSEALLAQAAACGVPARRIGVTGGDALALGPTGGPPWIDLATQDLAARWLRAIPRRLEDV